MEWRFGTGVINGAKIGRVMFEAYSGDTRYGYIAIDDILLDDSLSCPVKGVLMSAVWKFGKLMSIIFLIIS